MKFIAKRYKELRIVLDPAMTYIERGQRFKKGMLGIFPNGFAVEFVDKEYSTNDKKIIEALKAHKSYNVEFFSDDPEPSIISDEAARDLNEKREVADRAADTNHEPTMARKKE